MQDCLPYLQRAVNDPRLKERLCKIKKGEFTDCTLSGEEVYEVFMRGRQTGESSDDFEMDIDLTIYSTYPWIKTIGYTYPNTIRTWINRKYFLALTLAEICGNLSHEFCHKLGFTHTVHWTSVRDMSVPYFIGYLIRDLVAEIMNEDLRRSA